MRLWLALLVLAGLALGAPDGRFVPFTVAKPDGIPWKRPRAPEANAPLQSSIINVPTNCPANYIKVVNRCRRLY